MIDVKLVKRIHIWNAKRYDQIYDHNLTVSLLQEEFTELLDSENLVESIDALVDIFFVANGALWKLNESPYKEYIVTSMSIVNLKNLILSYETRYSKESQINSLLSISSACLNGLFRVLETEDNVEKAISIVCDSNDSKSIPESKVDPSIKANIDKGSNYVSPHKELQKLVNSMLN